jgi:hypothetical protein
MRTHAILLFIALAALAVRAAEPVNSPAAPATLPPEIRTALNNLSAEDFSVREKAFKDLEITLGRQTQELLVPTDPESKARVAALLEFNEGLSRWILDTIRLPDDQRRSLLAFGLSPGMLAIVAKLASPTPGTRIEGLHDLSRIKDPLATDLIAPLLDDDDRGVYVAAMEVVWDRQPTDAIVDRLWDRAVEAGFAIYNPQPSQQPDILFHGQLLGPTFFDNAAYRRMQDSNIASDVLVHLNAPQVGGKIKAFFEKVDRALATPNPRDNRFWMYGPNSAPMKNVYTLLDAYRPREAFPALYRLATGAMRQPFNGQINNAHYFWSNRTQPLATLLVLTDQHPEEYKLSQLTRPPGMWAFANQLDEDAAIKKLQAWWANNPQAYPATTAPAAAATEPAPTPDEDEPDSDPADPNAQ